MQIYFRNYGTSATINFDLYDPTGSTILTSAAISPSACVLSLDEGTSAFSTNVPVVRSNGFSIVFTSTELTAKRIHVKMSDTNPTKTWLDTGWNIETYGTSASQHGNIASGLLDNLLDGVPLRDLLIEAISQLTGDIIRTGDLFSYYKKDGSTLSHELSASYGARTKQ